MSPSVRQPRCFVISSHSGTRLASHSDDWPRKRCMRHIEDPTDHRPIPFFAITAQGIVPYVQTIAIWLLLLRVRIERSCLFKYYLILILLIGLYLLLIIYLLVMCNLCRGCLILRTSIDSIPKPSYNQVNIQKTIRLRSCTAESYDDEKTHLLCTTDLTHLL